MSDLDEPDDYKLKPAQRLFAVNTTDKDRRQTLKVCSGERELDAYLTQMKKLGYHKPEPNQKATAPMMMVLWEPLEPARR